MRVRIAVVLLLVSIVAGAAVGQETDESTEAWRTAIDLLTLEAVLGLYLETGPDVEIPGEWTAVARFAKDVDESFAERMPKRDGWGRTLVLRRENGSVVLASPGPDGVLHDPPEEGAGGEARRGDDLVLDLGSGEIVNGPKTARARQKRTMADLRSVGTVIESYSIDHNAYPLQLELAPVSGIASLVEPVYIFVMPREDGWGIPILYWSDSQSYVLVAPAADHAADGTYGVDSGALDPESFGGAFVGYGHDVVFADGQFVQWPEGRQIGLWGPGGAHDP